MKTTGVIKKMDELGRIVIPKEMRRVLNIHDGEVLEMFINDDNLIMKKHSSFESVLSKIKRIIEIFDSTNLAKCIVVDKERVIASNYDIVNLEINDVCKSYIANREEAVIDGEDWSLGNEKKLFFCPLITELDAVGGIIVAFDEELNEERKKIGRLLAKLIIDEMAQ